MKNIRSIFGLVTMLFSPFVFTNSGYGQIPSGYAYVNPRPNSNFVSATTNILIRPGKTLFRNTISNAVIQVSGSKSGLHQGTLVLANDNKTLIFKPVESFNTDELVMVNVQSGLKEADGTDIPGLSFTFHTCISSPVTLSAATGKAKPLQAQSPIKSVAKVNGSLPTDFPKLVINRSINPSSGYLFLSFYPYLVIADNEGTPVFYRNIVGFVYDFKLQPDGELTYFVYPTDCFGLNNSLQIDNTFSTTDGFSVDVHDLQLKPGGGYYIFGKRVVTMDLSTIVYDGLSDAQIIDGALQEFDASGNLVFEWDALDHYRITDVDANISLTDYEIDFSHFNSIEPDTDGNLLISARNLDEITKVNHKTGAIIWRFGGKNNNFTFVNDKTGFSRQHDARRFSNGNISLFDNGVYHSKQISSIVEYQLDEKNMTATLVKRFSHGDTLFSEAEGSVQELPNGNRLIGWGNVSQPAITEITPDNQIVYELSGSLGYDEYRAYRFKWQTSLFTTNLDSLDFGAVAAGGSTAKTIVLYNPQDSALSINEIYCADSSFSTKSALPIILPPKDSLAISLSFTPSKSGVYAASFNLRIDGNYNGSPQMIARQVMLSGRTNDIASAAGNLSSKRSYNLAQNYPNPFNPSTLIAYSIPENSHVSIKIYNVLGQLVNEPVNSIEAAGDYKLTWSGENNAGGKVPSGIYLYSIETEKFKAIKKMVLLK